MMMVVAMLMMMVVAMVMVLGMVAVMVMVTAMAMVMAMVVAVMVTMTMVTVMIVLRNMTMSYLKNLAVFIRKKCTKKLHGCCEEAARKQKVQVDALASASTSKI